MEAAAAARVHAAGDFDVARQDRRLAHVADDERPASRAFGAADLDRLPAVEQVVRVLHVDFDSAGVERRARQLRRLQQLHRRSRKRAPGGRHAAGRLLERRLGQRAGRTKHRVRLAAARLPIRHERARRAAADELTHKVARERRRHRRLVGAFDDARRILEPIKWDRRAAVGPHADVDGDAVLQRRHRPNCSTAVVRSSQGAVVCHVLRRCPAPIVRLAHL